MNDLITITLGDLLDKTARDYGDRLAVKCTDKPYERTWAEFKAECDLFARGFYDMGIRKGDHVAIWATNEPEWLITLFATAKIGAVLVTVNTNYKIFEAEYLFHQSDAKCIVMTKGFKDSCYTDIINELCPSLRYCKNGVMESEERLPALRSVVYIGHDECPEGMTSWDDLKTRAGNVAPSIIDDIAKDLDPHEVINMQYTSGTTGFPKGVMLTHYNIINNGKCIGDCMKFTEEDKLCICVPLFHCFGLVLAVMACITHGTAMVPINYRPLDVLDALAKEKCTAVHGVPTMFIAMLEHPEFKNFSFPNLRTGIMAGTTCPVKVMQQVVDEMNMREITIVFGQTEASPGCTQTTTGDSIDIRVSTVGRVLPHVEAKIVNPETGELLPPGVPGEFCARGYNIMRGYYKMPEETARVIDDDGWLHTGDLATVDKDGYYMITGRIKDMIIRGGENIYPMEIEEFIYTHPKVRDVQVIGVPSKEYGEEVMACIIPKDGMTMTEEEIKEYVKSHMARHKTPRYVTFMNSFPMTASGKIQKYKMREQAIKLLKIEEL